MKKKAEQIPEFKTEAEEREFWATHSPLDFMDRASVRKGIFPELKQFTVVTPHGTVS